MAQRIVREQLILNVVPVRALGGPDEESSRSLQRYILGLALVVLAAPIELYLREGKNLPWLGAARLRRCFAIATAEARTLNSIEHRHRIRSRRGAGVWCRAGLGSDIRKGRG